MGDKTKISWSDATWNPVRGCSRISEGCRHCYAETMAARIVRMANGKPTAYDGLVKIRDSDTGGEPNWVGGDGGTRRFAFGTEERWTGKVAFDTDKLAAPLRWRAPRRVFVNSMSDLFHEALTNEQIAAVFGVMAACPQHTFQVLTKRAKRMREWFAWMEIEENWSPNATMHVEVGPRLDDDEDDTLANRILDAQWPLPNVWLGVSVENQAAVDDRIPDLLATPAAVRFLSCEPLLGLIDLRSVQHKREFEAGAWTGDHDVCRPLQGRGPRVDWVIAGCESGPGARSCAVDWLRSLRDQCSAAGTAFFLKQAVEYATSRAVYPSKHAARVDTIHISCGDGSRRKTGGLIELPYLDGVQWAQFPEVKP